MNVKTTTMIREACTFVREELGIRLIKGGAWYEWDSHKIIATDPLGAVIIQHGAVPPGIDPKRAETMVNPGLCGAARKLLSVDQFWLYRFWMGYDRGFQIQFFEKDSDVPSKDEVSEFGLALSRELFK